jgi:hypothetical protein
MGDPVSVLLDGVAVYRAARLVTTDTIADRPREWVVARGGLLADGVECDWCVGLWLAAGAVGWRALSPGSWRVVRDVLVVGAVCGVVSGGVFRLTE